MEQLTANRLNLDAVSEFPGAGASFVESHRHKWYKYTNQVKRKFYTQVPYLSD